MSEEDALLESSFAAQARLDNHAQRHKYERRDHLSLSPFQSAMVNSPARFCFAQCGNQVGKSTGAAYKASYIATGTPIPNYSGRPIPNPGIQRTYKRVIWVLGGATGQTATAGVQTALFGDTISGEVGTGMIPLRCIKKVTFMHGVPGLISDAVIACDGGGVSIVRVRTYSQGFEALTSEAVDFILADEMIPNLQILSELTARLTATDGSLLMAATPGRQNSDVVRWFSDRE